MLLDWDYELAFVAVMGESKFFKRYCQLLKPHVQFQRSCPAHPSVFYTNLCYCGEVDIAGAKNTVEETVSAIGSNN